MKANFRRGANAAEGRTPDITIGPVFRARFDSDCGDCGFGINEGDPIRMVEEPTGTPAQAWCSDCVDDLRTKAERSNLTVGWSSNR